VRRLTVKEKMLLHLVEFSRLADRPQIPPELAREGIANAVSIHLKHVTVYIRSLMKEGLVIERVAHVANATQRRKVYELTDAGWRAAMRLRDCVREEVVRIRDGDAEREETVASVLETVGGKARILDVIRYAQEGPIDVAVLRASPRAAFVEKMSDAPRLRRFVGRRAELAAIVSDGEGPRIFVVRGVAGIGKTSLAARACELLRGKKNVFWHRVRPWDTSISLFLGLGDFLKACGRPKLRAVIARGEVARAPDILREDLREFRAFLVFDDMHEAGLDALPYFQCLREAVGHSPDVSAVFLSRKSVPFYDRRNVVLDALVREIDLSGLDAPDIEEFFADASEAPLAVQLGLKLGGHPLSLELVRAHTHSAPSPEALRDVERFVEEVIYSELSEPQRRMTKLASLYQVPVPRDALFPDAELNSDVLFSLSERSLVRRTGESDFGVHDAIRFAFAGMMSASERDALGEFAVNELRALASNAQKAGDLSRCIGCLSNALELATAPDSRRDLLERLASACDQVGDYSRAQRAYESALQLAEGELARVRILVGLGGIHQKKGEYETADALCRDALRFVDGQESGEEAAALHVLGSVHAGRGEHDQALDCFNRSLAIRERTCDDQGIVASLNVMGFVHVVQRDYERAREVSERSLSISEKIRDDQGVALALKTIAIALSRRGDHDRALDYLTRSLSISERIGDQALAARDLINIGNVHGRRGDCERALEFYRRSLSISEKIGDRERAGIALMNTGVIHGMCGDERSLEYCERARSIFEGIGDLAHLAHSLSSIASIRIVHGELDRALELSERALSVSEGIRYEEGIARSLSFIAIVHSARGDYDRALEFGKRSHLVSEKVRDPEGVALSLETLGNVHLSRGDYMSALRFAERAVDTARGARLFSSIAVSQLLLAETSLRLGNHSRAEGICQELLDLAAQPAMKPCLPRLLRIAGLLDWNRGFWSESTRRFEESLRLSRELGQRHDEARSHYEFGLMWGAKGHAGMAREHLTAATAILERIGAREEYARARNVLRGMVDSNPLYGSVRPQEGASCAQAMGGDPQFGEEGRRSPSAHKRRG